jgi:hypothetical protein
MWCRIASPRIERRSCIAGYSATRASICMSHRPTRRGSISWNASLALLTRESLAPRLAHVPQLRAAILAYVEAHNDKGKPFTWTKTADEILDKMRRFGLRTQQVHAQCHEPRKWQSRAGSFTWKSGRKFHQQVRDLFGHRDGCVMGTRQFAIAPKLGALCHRGVLVEAGV